MIREVHEETGLVVEDTGLATVDAIATQNTQHAFHGIRIIYRTRLLGGQLTNEVDGTTDQCRWWHRDELDRVERVELAKTGCDLAFNERDESR